ncbi:MAG: HAD-IA family hydrolase [Bacteroidota bacterium]
MEHMIQMIVFDMAGTTVNEHNLVYKTLHAVLNEAGYEASLELVLLHGAGKEKLQAFRDILATFPEEVGDTEAKARTLHTAFVQRLNPAYATAEVSAFADCEPLFTYLQHRDIKVVLNTGYDRPTANQLLARLGWREGTQIDLSVTSDDVVQGRPHPDMIRLAMQRLGIEDPAQVAKVGDSIIDIEEGKAAGCGLTFGVTTGAHTADQLASAAPDHVIGRLDEIRAWV